MFPTDANQTLESDIENASLLLKASLSGHCPVYPGGPRLEHLPLQASLPLISRDVT